MSSHVPRRPAAWRETLHRHHAARRWTTRASSCTRCPVCTTSPSRYFKKVLCIIATYEAFVQSDPDDNGLATEEEVVRRYLGKLRYCKGQVCGC